LKDIITKNKMVGIFAVFRIDLKKRSFLNNSILNKPQKRTGAYSFDILSDLEIIQRQMRFLH
jgi:hypothetical protein